MYDRFADFHIDSNGTPQMAVTQILQILEENP